MRGVGVAMDRPIFIIHGWRDGQEVWYTTRNPIDNEAAIALFKAFGWECDSRVGYELVPDIKRDKK